jgi:hypothetical protein
VSAKAAGDVLTSMLPASMDATAAKLAALRRQARSLRPLMP